MDIVSLHPPPGFPSLITDTHYRFPKGDCTYHLTHHRTDYDRCRLPGRERYLIKHRYSAGRTTRLALMQTNRSALSLLRRFISRHVWHTEGVGRYFWRYENPANYMYCWVSPPFSLRVASFLLHLCRHSCGASDRTRKSLISTSTLAARSSC